MEETHFQWPDYVVLFLVLGISAAVGFYYACTGGKQRTTREYYLANKEMHWFPVACSLNASFISSNTLIGSPAHVYTYGYMLTFQGVGFVAATFIALIFLLPIYERLQVSNSYKYIELRFNKPIKIMVIILDVLSGTIHSATIIYGPALSMSAVTGMDIWLAICSIAFIAVLYTLLGGLKAVLWTDAIQLCIMYAGLFLVLIYGCIQQGGFAKVWEANKQSGRLNFLEVDKIFSFDPRMSNTIWANVICGSVLLLRVMGANQASVQRYLILRTTKDKFIAYACGAVGTFLLWTLSCTLGLVIFSYFRYCDPLSTGEIVSKDQIYPLYIMKLLGHLPGVPGLLLSSIFSGSLSSISSTLNAMAMVIFQEFIKPCQPGMSEKKATLISKAIVFAFGAIFITFATIAKYLGKGVVALSFTLGGALAGPTIALFIVGIFLPVANWKGSAIGFVLGVGYGLLMGLGGVLSTGYVYKYPVTTTGCNITDSDLLANLTSPVYDPATWDPHSHFRSGFNSLFDLSGFYTGIGTASVTIIASLIFSLILGRKDDPLIDEKQLSPYLMKSCCLLPASWRSRIKYEREGDLQDEKDKHSTNKIQVTTT